MVDSAPGGLFPQPGGPLLGINCVTSVGPKVSRKQTAVSVQNRHSVTFGMIAPWRLWVRTSRQGTSECVGILRCFSSCGHVCSIRSTGIREDWPVFSYLRPAPGARWAWHFRGSLGGRLGTSGGMRAPAGSGARSARCRPGGIRYPTQFVVHSGWGAKRGGLSKHSTCLLGACSPWLDICPAQAVQLAAADIVQRKPGGLALAAARSDANVITARRVVQMFQRGRGRTEDDRVFSDGARRSRRYRAPSCCLNAIGRVSSTDSPRPGAGGKDRRRYV